jgi:metal-responsive CopG/Arc/MetJ family transcriptional regulator
MTDLERTQIYLTRAELSALDRIKEETGVSQSELVRRAIDRTYLGRDARSREERLAIVDKAAGAWTDRSETGAEYVERLRSGRLARTHARRR